MNYFGDTTPLRRHQIYAYSCHHRAKMRGRWNNCELVYDASMLLPRYLFVLFLPSACGRPKGIVVIQASVCPSVTHDYTVNFLTQRFRDIILGQKVAQGL